MGHPPIEELLPKSGMSIYKLSRLAANRATELALGKKPLVEASGITKTATVALEEVRAGMVVYAGVADQFDRPAPAATVSQGAGEAAAVEVTGSDDKE